MLYVSPLLSSLVFFRAVDPRIIRERVREREAKIAAKENKVRPPSLATKRDPTHIRAINEAVSFENVKMYE